MKIVAFSGSKFAQFLTRTGLVLAISALPARAGSPPANDNFADRTALTGQSALVSTYNNNATVETGDPSLGNRTLTRTLWWSWTAPYTGWANFSTFGSDGPLVVGVFVGDSLPELSSVGVSNGEPWYLSYGSLSYGHFSYNYQPMAGESVNLPVESGKTYQIEVAASAFSYSSIGRVVLGINQPPTILSNAVVCGTTGSSLSYQISASNWPTTYDAQGLPGGLTVDPYSGIISGKPTAIGSFDAVVSATGPGGTGQATVRFEVTQANAPSTAPVFTSSYAVNKGMLGTPLSIYVYATGATQITAGTLPPGLTFADDSSSGYAYLSGTPTQVGTFTVPIHASNSVGTTDAQIAFQIRERPPLPAFYSAAVSYGTVGKTFTYWIDASDMTNGTYTVGTLPAGLQLSGTTTISGTPAQAGTFEIPVTATNAAGSTSATLTIVIADSPTPTPTPIPTAPPVITSSAGVSALGGTYFGYSLSSNDPTAQYSASGLPDGLSINPTNGSISGVPTTTGTYIANITATNSIGSTTTPLTLAIQGFSPFGLTSPAMATGNVNTRFTYLFLLQSFYPTSYSSQVPKISINTGDLPPGLTYTPSPSSYYYSYSAFPVGTISGIPKTTGIFQVPLTTTFGGVSIHSTLTLVIAPATAQPPVITSAASSQGYIDQSFSYSVAASNSPTTYSATDLPPGLSVDSNSGAIQGIPTQAGTFVVPITATNAVGTAHAKLTISIQAATPVRFSIPFATEGNVGVWMYNYINYSTPRSGAKLSVSELPPGLQLTSYGAITGTPTAAGTYSVAISVSDAAGTWNTVETFVIHPKPAPVITSALMAQGNVGDDTFYYNPEASDYSASFLVGNLPNGIGWSAANNLISGTPSQVGNFAVSLAATNEGGSSTAVLTLQIGNPKPPQLSLPASYQTYVGASFTDWLYGSNPITSYEISGKLPAGITYDSSAHNFTGAATESGVFPLQITATGPGGSTTAPLTFEVDPLPLPVISTPLVAYFPAYSGYGSCYLTAYNSVTSFSVQGLPSGIKFSNYSTYGYLTGAILSSGEYPVTVTAKNSTGSSSAVVTLTTDIALDYGFNSAMTTATLNKSFSYYLYDGSESFMANRKYSATGLPPGLAINSSSGIISGIPTAPGTYSVNITATHSTYATLQLTLTILVNAAPDLPVITSQSVLSGVVGQSLTSWISVSGEATTYGLDVVPPGLAFDSATGLLKGTPTAAGKYKVKASASNAGGTRTVDMVIDIAPSLPPPIFTSSAGLQGTVGESFSSFLDATNIPTSYTANGLPSGLILDATTGKISGVPLLAGHYPVKVSATNAGGTTTAMLTIDILGAQTPVITSESEMTSSLQSPFYFTLRASHNPTSFTASNLPPGLILDSKTGAITGTPTAVGDYTVLVTATNAGTSATGTLVIHIPNTAGYLVSAAEAVGLIGQKMSIPLSSSSGTPTFSVEGLPSGLTLPSGSTTVSGTPTEAGRYEVTVHTMTGGVETKSVLTLDIAASPVDPPVIGGALLGWVGSGLSYAANVSNQPTQISARNLPDGLTLDSATGVISGAPKSSGDYDVTIIATNAVGTSTAVVTLTTIAPQVPVVTTSANLYAVTDKSISLPASLSTNFYSSYYYYPYYYPYRYPYSLASALGPIIAVAGLPPGLIFDSASGRIEGTAIKAGDYLLAITATTPLAATTTYTMLHVTDTPPAAASMLQVSSGVYLNAFGAVGSPFQFGLTPVGLATDVTCTGLPDGLNLQKTAITSNGTPSITAAITGSPVKAGTYPVKFTFSNSTQTASGTVTIVVPDSPELPSFSGSLAASGVVGRSFSYYIGDGSGYATSSSVSLNNAASTGDGISMINVSGLPPGLQFNSLSNSITGTPSTAGSYVVPISLTNAGGTTSASVLITIADQQLAAPQLLGSGTSLGASTVSFAGEPIHLSLDAANSTTNVTASGLPDGVTLGQATDGSWTLSGTPAAAGIYNLFLTATSNQGTETVPLTLNVRQLDQSVPPPQPDAIPSPTPVSTPPTVVVNQPRVDTTDDQVTVRGRVLAYQPGCTVTVKAGAQSWQRLRVSPDGSFKLNLANLPVGITHVTIRTRDSSGNVRIARILVHRHIG